MNNVVEPIHFLFWPRDCLAVRTDPTVASIRGRGAATELTEHLCIVADGVVHKEERGQDIFEPTTGRYAVEKVEFERLVPVWDSLTVITQGT